MRLLTIILTLAAAISASALTQINSELPQVREVVVGVNDALIPTGFDSTTDSYAIVSGIFPNGCYMYRRAQVSHKASNLHEVHVVAGVSQGMCLQVLIPYTKEVSLGQLAVGKHTIRFIGGDGTYLEKNLVIEE